MFWRERFAGIDGNDPVATASLQVSGVELPYVTVAHGESHTLGAWELAVSSRNGICMRLRSDGNDVSAICMRGSVLSASHGNSPARARAVVVGAGSYFVWRRGTSPR